MGLKSLELSRGIFSTLESARSAIQMGVVCPPRYRFHAACHCEQRHVGDARAVGRIAASIADGQRQLLGEAALDAHGEESWARRRAAVARRAEQDALAVGRPADGARRAGMLGEPLGDAARGRDTTTSTLPSYSPVKATIGPVGREDGSVSIPGAVVRRRASPPSRADDPQVAGLGENDLGPAERRLLEKKRLSSGPERGLMPAPGSGPSREILKRVVISGSLEKTPPGGQSMISMFAPAPENVNPATARAKLTFPGPRLYLSLMSAKSPAGLAILLISLLGLAFASGSQEAPAQPAGAIRTFLAARSAKDDDTLPEEARKGFEDDDGRPLKAVALDLNGDGKVETFLSGVPSKSGGSQWIVWDEAASAVRGLIVGSIIFVGGRRTDLPQARDLLETGRGHVRCLQLHLQPRKIRPGQFTLADRPEINEYFRTELPDRPRQRAGRDQSGP